MVTAREDKQCYASPLQREVLREKDAIFDDPPTAAYQIEQGLKFVRQHSDTKPALLVPLDQQDFVAFYERMIRWLYELAAKR